MSKGTLTTLLFSATLAGNAGASIGSMSSPSRIVETRAPLPPERSLDACTFIHPENHWPVAAAAVAPEAT